MMLPAANGRRSNPRRSIATGIGANRQQFVLLVALNAFVGAMVGLERSIMPVLAQDEFGVGSATAAISFIASFGAAKAVANLFAGAISDRLGRRPVLIAGWLLGVPVPLMVIWAPDWNWVIAANLLLGLNQGLAWSMTVNMKLDLVGPKQRGLALGLNEAAGYLAVAAGAYVSGAVAEAYGLRPEPFYLGIAVTAFGLALSVLFVRDTTAVAAASAGASGVDRDRASLRRAFADATWRRPRLFAVSQAGFVTNLNDALAWGIFPLFFLSRGLDLERIGLLAAAYPLVWGVLQVGTGWLSDIVGRRPLIGGGMLLQAAALAAITVFDSFAGWLAAVALLGAGTAMVYPALIASISDAVPAAQRATTIGVYRFWRDSGAVAGAIAAGIVADAINFEASILAVTVITALSGIVATIMLVKADGRDPFPTVRHIRTEVPDGRDTVRT
jgi:MFS family permease